MPAFLLSPLFLRAMGALLLVIALISLWSWGTNHYREEGRQALLGEQSVAAAKMKSEQDAKLSTVVTDYVTGVHEDDQTIPMLAGVIGTVCLRDTGPDSPAMPTIAPKPADKAKPAQDREFVEALQSDLGFCVRYTRQLTSLIDAIKAAQ